MAQSVPSENRARTGRRVSSGIIYKKKYVLMRLRFSFKVERNSSVVLRLYEEKQVFDFS